MNSRREKMLGKILVSEKDYEETIAENLKLKKQNEELREMNRKLEINLRMMWNDKKCKPTKILKEFMAFFQSKVQFVVPTQIFYDFIRQKEYSKE